MTFLVPGSALRGHARDEIEIEGEDPNKSQNITRAKTDRFRTQRRQQIRPHAGVGPPRQPRPPGYLPYPETHIPLFQTTGQKRLP